MIIWETKSLQQNFVQNFKENKLTQMNKLQAKHFSHMPSIIKYMSPVVGW
jgi:hypothetical protein